jgi:hypothetical protein
MKKLALAVVLVFSGAAYAQDLGVKPGLWESKVIHQVVDGKEMSAQMAATMAKMQERMAKLSPDQRKQMEGMMGGMGHGGTVRMCISPAMAARDEHWVNSNSECGSSTKVTRSGNKVSFSIDCTANGRTTVGAGESTINGDSVTTHMDVAVTDAYGHHTMVMDSQMSYLGADCQGVKPIDELAKSVQAPGK